MAHQRILSVSVVAVFLLLSGVSNRVVSTEQSVQEENDKWLSYLLDYLAEKGVNSNAGSVVEDMRRQAETGDPRAYFNLGYLYRDGPVFTGDVTVKKDPVAAIEAYAHAIAAATGNDSYQSLVAQAKFEAKRLMTKHELSATDISKDAAAYFVEAPRPSAALGWDLSYRTILSDTDYWLMNWLGFDYRSPIEDVLSEYKDTTVSSSVLLEFPVIPEGGHAVAWLVETPRHTQIHVFVERELQQRKTIMGEQYAELFRQVNTWEQASPPPRPATEDSTTLPDFIGFVNIYQKDSGGRQFKLIPYDLVSGATEYGRVYQLLIPLFETELTGLIRKN